MKNTIAYMLQYNKETNECEVFARKFKDGITAESFNTLKDTERGFFIQTLKKVSIKTAETFISAKDMANYKEVNKLAYAIKFLELEKYNTVTFEECLNKIETITNNLKVASVTTEKQTNTEMSR